MPSGGKIYAKALSAAVFIILEIAAIGLLKRSSQMQDVWLNRLSYQALAKVWGAGEHFRNYFSLRKVNEELSEENLQLRKALIETEQALERISADSVRAQMPEGRFRFIPARVVKISRNSQHNYIILDKGSEDGIIPHSGIISGDGVVGIVDAVDRHYSYGLTLMNSRISVSVRSGPEGIVSSLVWAGTSTDRALLKEFPAQGVIGKGDTVCTSGLSSVFPGEIPVGFVSSEPSLSGIAKNVDVTLFQDFSAVKYVIVTADTQAQEISGLEKKEDRK